MFSSAIECERKSETEAGGEAGGEVGVVVVGRGALPSRGSPTSSVVGL